jgi:leader peptidase (prepilin peptidase)/N-methyltransferase
VPTLSELPPWLLTFVAVSLGAAFGSFLNVVIYRLPRGESVVHPGSRCPGCGTPIRALDNLPILSWLLLRGRSRCCKSRISPRYVLVEVVGALLAWAILATRIQTLAPDTPIWLAALLFSLYLAVGLGLVAAAFIDLSHMYLPDSITLGGAVLGILGALVRPDISLVQSLAGAAIGFAMIWLPFDLGYRLLRGQPGMGLGDAKLVMLAGAWFGWQGAVFTLLAGAVQGTIVTIGVYLAQGRIEEPEAVRLEREQRQRELGELPEAERAELERELALDPLALPPEPGLGKARLAFGPFLVLAALEFLLFGDALASAVLAFAWAP